MWGYFTEQNRRKMAFKTIFATVTCTPSLATVSACESRTCCKLAGRRRGHYRQKRFVPQTENDKEGGRANVGRKTARLRRRNMTLSPSLSFLAPSFAHKRRLDGGQKMKTRAGRNNDAAAVCVNIANTTRRGLPPPSPRSTLVCCTSVRPS